MPMVPTPMRSFTPGFPPPPRTERGINIGAATPAAVPMRAFQRVMARRVVVIVASAFYFQAVALPARQESVCRSCNAKSTTRTSTGLVTRRGIKGRGQSFKPLNSLHKWADTLGIRNALYVVISEAEQD